VGEGIRLAAGRVAGGRVGKGDGLGVGQGVELGTASGAGWQADAISRSDRSRAWIRREGTSRFIEAAILIS